MRNRDPVLDKNWDKLCSQVSMVASDGKRYLTNAADLQGILRIVQSVPSPKAEPLKLWLAKVGQERIDEIIDPERAIDRALDNYLKKGYSREWVHQRLLSIRIRNELTEEWRSRGVKGGGEYAILTDEISKAWSNMSTREYKKFKGLKKENLRDNMSDVELVLTMLAEASTRDISRVTKPNGLPENKDVAKRGGGVARSAREALEAETGEPAISKMNAQDFRSLITEAINDATSLPEKYQTLTKKKRNGGKN